MVPKTTAKRRPGGGRKPQGRIAGNQKPMNLRVRPEVHAEIERAAKRNKLSLNQEIQERLIVSLEYDRKVPRFRHLMILMGKVAKIIEGKTGNSWIKDPYTAKMLRAAVDCLIAELGAKGDVVVPAAIAKETERLRAVALNPDAHPREFGVPNPSTDPQELGAGEALFIIGQIRARQYSSKVFNSLFNPHLPAKEWRKHGYSKFDDLIDDLDLS